MKKVITYGTYDLLHYGHVKLLERAKKLGDYLIVGVTADDFDKTRGKINVQQSLMERVEAVRATGIADEIIIEEYEGQKISDIIHYGVDIFTVGDDWEGQFDYLKKYCDVIYLKRTEGISSTEIRSKIRLVKVGLIGDDKYLKKVIKEASYVNGMEISGIYTRDKDKFVENDIVIYDEYEMLLKNSDAVYIHSLPNNHYLDIKKALINNKHVLCESPLTFSEKEYYELKKIAAKNNLIFMDSLRTAFSTAYNRMLLLVKSGKIGQVVSIDATCTSLKDFYNHQESDFSNTWGSLAAWGPTAMLPIFNILGTSFKEQNIFVKFSEKNEKYDLYTMIHFLYENAIASIKVGTGVKSESCLIISGTKGYVYVPAPWWKTEYFEIRYENQSDNKRYFYQLDGEGIRFEFVAFIRAISKHVYVDGIDSNISLSICKIMEEFIVKRNYIELK